ncbi:MAG: methylated-DNA--[protein]-cysteine S-methyltransferase [Bacillota bacterium]
MKYAILKTGWGFVGAIGSDKGLFYLALPKESYEEAYAELTKEKDLEALTEDFSFFHPLYRELENYLQGKPFDFGQFPLLWDRVTPYRLKVLKRALEIPYGETRTYKWLAEGAGNPKGARSAGQAMATNPWPIIVPCHRVVGSNGKLTGFGGGIPMKERLLALESGKD